MGIATATSQLHFPASHGCLCFSGQYPPYLLNALSFTVSGLRGGFGGSGQEISRQPKMSELLRSVGSGRRPVWLLLASARIECEVVEQLGRADFLFLRLLPQLAN